MAENNYIHEDLHNMCRLCFSNSSLVSIFDHRLEFAQNMTEVIELTTGVKITPHDEISHMLCNKCTHLTIKMFKFRTTSILNDLDLREKAARRRAMHKSVKDLFKEYPKLEVPSHIVKRNISPLVVMENLKHHPTTACKKISKRKLSRSDRTRRISTKNNAVMETYRENSEPPLQCGTTSIVDASPKESYADNSNEEPSSSNILKRNSCSSWEEPVNKKSKETLLLEENDENYNEKSLFTVKSKSKTLFVCDLCEKIFYSNRELKKHKNQHMRCNLCRTEFNSLEKTKEHEKKCSFKKIMSNLPFVDIERCDEIKAIRKKYSDAFEIFSVIEISDDEQDDSFSKTDEGVIKPHEETIVEKSCRDMVKSGTQRIPEISENTIKSNFTSTSTKEIINVSAAHAGKKEQTKNIINEKIDNCKVTNRESDSGESENFVCSNIGKSTEFADPKTTKRKTGIVECTEMTNTNKSRKIENLKVFSLKMNDMKLSASENSRKATISNKLKETPESDKSSINSANSEDLSIIKDSTKTRKVDISEEENNSEQTREDININGEPLQGDSYSDKSREIEKSVFPSDTSKINLELTSDKSAKTASSEVILRKKKEESKELDKSETSISNNCNEKLLPERSEGTITTDNTKETILPSQASDNDSTQTTKMKDSIGESISERFKDLIMRKSEITSASVNHSVVRSSVECVENGNAGKPITNMPSIHGTSRQIGDPDMSRKSKNTGASSSVSKETVPNQNETTTYENSGKTRDPAKYEPINALEMSLHSKKSAEQDGNKKHDKIFPPVNPEHITNIEKTKTKSQFNDTKIRPDIEDPKVSNELKENLKDAKKPKKQSNIASNKNNQKSNGKNVFKPTVLLVDNDALEVNSDDDDSICLKNLIQRMRKNKKMKDRVVQTNLPSNSDIVPIQKDGYLYELTNLRNYLGYSNIPVNISLGKSFSVKYTYEPSSLMKNQSKLRTNNKKTITQNEVLMVKRKEDGQPQSSQNPAVSSEPSYTNSGNNISIVGDALGISHFDQQAVKILNPTIQVGNVREVAAVPNNTNGDNSSAPSSNLPVNGNITLYNNSVITPQIINISNNSTFPMLNYSNNIITMQNVVNYQNTQPNFFVVSNPNGNTIVSNASVFPPIETTQNSTGVIGTDNRFSSAVQTTLHGVSTNVSSSSATEVSTNRVSLPVQKIPPRPIRPIRPMPEEVREMSSSSQEILNDVQSKQIFTCPRVPPMKRISKTRVFPSSSGSKTVKRVPNSTIENIDDCVVVDTDKDPIQNKNNAESVAMPENRYIRVKSLAELR